MPDIRQLLETARTAAPPPRFDVDDIVDAGRRRSRSILTQRIGGAAVVAAAVTGLLLVGSNVVLSGGGKDPAGELPAPVQPAAPAGAPFRFTFTGYSVGDFRILTPNEVTTTHQVATIVADYQDASGKPTAVSMGIIRVYLPSVVPPAQFTSGTALTVQGRQAYLNEVPLASASKAPAFEFDTSGQLNDYLALAFQYAEGAWAVIHSEPYNPEHALTPADAQAIAEAFRNPTTEVVPKIPFQLGYLPAGWELVTVQGQSFSAEDTGSIRVTYATPDPGADPQQRPYVEIYIGQVDTPPPDAPDNVDICSLILTFRMCSWELPGNKYYLGLRTRSGTLPDEEMLRIGESLLLANLDQPETWYRLP